MKHKVCGFQLASSLHASADTDDVLTINGALKGLAWRGQSLQE